MNWVQWLDGVGHSRRHGHWPAWYNLGAGKRQCVNCLKGGHRKRWINPFRLSPRPVPF